jgi:hypothetical protein
MKNRESKGVGTLEKNNFFSWFKIGYEVFLKNNFCDLTTPQFDIFTHLLIAKYAHNNFI